MSTAFFINEVSKEELMALSGIGSVLADRIIAARNFTNRNEIIEVHGIGNTSLLHIERQNAIQFQFGSRPLGGRLSNFLEGPLHMRNDSSGLGHWHAPRGDRLHRGVDVITVAGQRVVAPINGLVTKYGHSSAQNLNLRYVEITGHNEDGDLLVRIHYCTITGQGIVNTSVRRGSHIGFAQDVPREYRDPHMINHVHFELRVNGVVSDPTGYLDLV